MPEIWCDITGPADLGAVGGLINHTPVDHVLVRPAQAARLPEVRLHDRVQVACLAEDPGDLPRAAELGGTVVVTDSELIGAVRETGRAAGLRVTVGDGPSLRHCRDMIGRVDHLLVDFTDPTNIPLELLLAAAQGTGTRVVKKVTGHGDAVVSSGVLESGPAGLLFAVDDIEEAGRLMPRLLRAQRFDIPLVEATVTAVRHAGMGYRGCVDTTWLFEQDEGMIVGSTSSGGLVVCAEVHHLPYMNLRPFRVNAGAVHSYVWSDGGTEYITDLSAGGTVLAVNTAGSAYPVRVGRVKTELRPLRLIQAVAGGVPLNVFVQDDWHVRIFDADGRPMNCTSVEPGTRLLAHVCEPGRHVGIKVSEAIVEN
ncbi:3-dehydroquinate synthase II [Sphaerisporangium corydalis]|uniref:3-dehydroquinate synthase II n=1 Tax=Sphaerisporangium corydalis TaxID=1441875 RepID=A0ABV9E5P7_9ACTN|nr:3-dehydroquinate synthase II [Sphaerisporangium corydalis]